MALDPNEKKSQAIRRYLVLTLVSLQLITVLLILSFNYFSTDKDIENQIFVLLQNALNESKEHAKGFLQPAYRNVNISVDLLQNNTLSINDKAELETYFLSQLQNNKEMTGIYIASPEGNFYFVTRDTRPEKTGFMTKIIDNKNPGKASFFWRNHQLDIIESKVDQEDNFNALQRPWYKKAVEQKSLIWTEPYIFFTSKQPGITVAAPFYSKAGELEGVVGIDIELTSISRFLADLKVYGSVSVFMASDSGNFVAAPSISAENTILNTLDSTMASAEILEVEKKAINYFLNNLLGESQFSSSRKVQHKQDGQFILYEPFLAENGPKWIIGAYAPEKELLSTIRSGKDRNTIIALAILCISLIVGWLLIRKTWQPFERFFHDVITDQLTGLFNRRFLENIGSRMYIRLLRDQHEAISIAVIDLDNFRKINLEFGNATGNKVLIAFADFLKKTLRQEDIINRYSGDTFVIIFPGFDNAHAVAVVDKMRRKLDSWPLAVDDLLVRVTFSAGIETIDDTTRIADAAFSDFIEVAKRAMRNAKEAGRDQVISASDKIGA